MTFAPDPADIDVRFRVSQAGPVNFSSARSSANALHRTSALVRRDHVPQVFLAVQVAGTTRHRAGRDQAVLRPGDMAIYDSTRPYTVENRELDRAALLPHPPRRPRPARSSGSTHCSPCGSAPTPTRWPRRRLLLHHPGRPRRRSTDPMPRERSPSPASSSCAPCSPSTSATTTSAREPAGRLARPAGPAVRARPSARARPHPATIAAAHHVSVRQLYAVLARAGISLRDQHPGAAARGSAAGSCGTPATPTWPSPRSARRWGFVDPSHFGRVFRQTFGVTPSEWRRSAGTDAGDF